MPEYRVRAAPAGGGLVCCDRAVTARAAPLSRSMDLLRHRNMPFASGQNFRFGSFALLPCPADVRFASDHCYARRHACVENLRKTNLALAQRLPHAIGGRHDAGADQYGAIRSPQGRGVLLVRAAPLRAGAAKST